MQHLTSGVIAWRRPAELEAGTVIIPPRFDQAETVRRTRQGPLGWLVRTDTNLHLIKADTKVAVLAEYVPGIGWITEPDDELERFERLLARADAWVAGWLGEPPAGYDAHAYADGWRSRHTDTANQPERANA